MQAYDFEAVTASGDRLSGHQLATSELDLDRLLEGRGLVLTSSKLTPEGKQSSNGAFSRDELVMFTTQLATVAGAGVPVVSGLEGIGQRLETPRSKALAQTMVAGLRKGDSLSEVMAPFPRTFSVTYQASVKAGEASGSLDRVLLKMAKHLEWARAMRSTTVQALIYPSFLMVAILGLILILLFHVLPQLMGLFPAGKEADLPWQTKIVMGASDLVRENGLLVGGGLLALVVASVLAWRLPSVRLLLGRFVLAVPKLGTIVKKLAMSRFASTASTLQAAGCDDFTVLEVASESCGNCVLQQSFARSIERVRRGESISEALGKEPLVDSLLVQMVSVGERAGALDLTLERLAEYYDDDVPRAVKRFLSVFEPTLLLAASVVVAFILMAAIMPLFQIYESIG